MDADALGDIVERDRRSMEPALRAPGAGRLYDYRRFCTNAWKVGNFLRHLGVRGGDGVAIADDSSPEAVLTLYGAALLGAVVRFAPSGAPDDDVRTLVVPESVLDAHDIGPSTKPVVYGDVPADVAVPEDELGDTLFALLALCVELDVDAGTALETSLSKYEDRLAETGDAGSGE